MARRYGISTPGIPVIFIGNSVLVGDTEIRDRFEKEILAEQQRLASCNTTYQPPPEPPGTDCPAATPPASLQLIIFAAIIDSTNPCGLSVLVFLLLTMTAAGNRRRILLAGGAYIAAMFLFHLLVGVGLFSVFSLSGLSVAFSLAGAGLAIVLGLITVADVLRNRDTFLLSIPDSQKGILANYLRIASVPAAFILGILAGVLGFSCTGGIYISILGLMGRNMGLFEGLPLLVLYNLVFVLPLVLVTLLVAYGIPPEKMETWKREQKRALRLVIGGILIAIGAVILLGWIG